MRKIICQKLELTDSFWSLPRTSHSLSRWVSTKPLRKWWQSWLVSTRHGRNTLVFQSIKSLLRCFAVHDYSQLAPCHSRWAGTPSTLPWRSLWHLSLPFMIPFWFNVCICGPAHPAHGRCKQSKLLWQDIGRTHVSQGPSYIHWAKKVEPVVVRWSPWKWQVSIVSTCHCCIGWYPEVIGVTGGFLPATRHCAKPLLKKTSASSNLGLSMWNKSLTYSKTWCHLFRALIKGAAAVPVLVALTCLPRDWTSGSSQCLPLKTHSRHP